MTVEVGGQTAVVLNDYDLIKSCYQSNIFNGRPKLCAFETAFGLGAGIGTGQHLHWREQRRLAVSTLRTIQFGEGITMAGIVEAEAGKLLDDLAQHKGRPLNLTHILPKAVCNIVCAFVFGKPFEYSDPRYILMLWLVYQNFKLAGPSAVVYSSGFLAKLPFGPGKRLVDNLRAFKQFAEDHIAEHRESFDGAHIRDFIDAYLLKIEESRTGSMEESEVYKHLNLVWCVNDLFGAGTETTAGTLRWAFLYMVLYPNVQKRIQDELDCVVGRGRMPVLRDKENLPYVEAAIQEINRHADIGPMGVAHATTEETQLLGYTIPKGTLTMANAHLCHFNEEYFENPRQFNPDRFINSDGSFIKREEVIAFSIGKRTCPGEELARMELFFFLTHILHRYEVTIAEGSPRPTLEGYTSITRVPHPYMVQLKER
ncbi:Vitamin D 25-hydroxylase [Holothuria leucospilota]|uniref:Vitamin D 25-hydroxylase n=1 Tax=Holothuria leucospilota TaxID=206669 RepID=A0A9Q0YNK2_HOLLE|nr:Vitamin D 25-hydroxylase [Holothuria leucospilota]